MKELAASRKQGEPKRRWFHGQRLDLIVWLSEEGGISGFQLCYDRGRTERALTWTREGGYSHDRIDDGEGDPTKNQTPILMPDGRFPARAILEELANEAWTVDPGIRRFVVEQVAAYEGRVRK